MGRRTRGSSDPARLLEQRWWRPCLRVWTRGIHKALIGLMFLTMPLLAGAPALFVVPAGQPGTGQDVSEPKTALRATVQQAWGEAPPLQTVTDLKAALDTATPGSLFVLETTPGPVLTQAGLTPLATFSAANVSGQVLLMRRGGDKNALKSARMATRPLNEAAQAELEPHLLKPLGFSLDVVKKVEVGKGLDVLLALKNGQVDLGLISELELTQASRIAPQLIGAVEVLGSSTAPILTLAMRRGEVPTAQLQTLLTGLQALPGSNNGSWHVVGMSQAAGNSTGGTEPARTGGQP